MKNKKQTTNLISILILIFYFPFGIPFMWITGSFSLKTRWIVTLSFIAAIVIGLGSIILWTSSPGYIH